MSFYHKKFLLINKRFSFQKNNLKDNECIVRFLTVINGIVFFSCHKQFYALDIRDRELLWVKKYKNKIKSPLVASLKYDMIYLCEGHNITTLHCLDILSGEETFQYKLHKIWWASPSLYNDKLYIACFEGGLFIVDLFKNQRKLKFAFNQLELNKKWFKGVDFLAINNKELRLRSFFAMDGAMQYLSVSTHGLLQGFDLDNKKSALWTYKFEKESLNPDTDYPITSPIITEKNIYVAAYKSIYGLKKQHNKAPKLLWRVQTTGTILCEPVISDGTVFCASTDGNLYVLK